LLIKYKNELNLTIKGNTPGWTKTYSTAPNFIIYSFDSRNEALLSNLIIFLVFHLSFQNIKKNQNSRGILAVSRLCRERQKSKEVRYFLRLYYSKWYNHGRLSLTILNVRAQSFSHSVRWVWPIRIIKSWITNWIILILI
jgi:hypothetical protein